jgi:hypothetical protein
MGVNTVVLLKFLICIFKGTMNSQLKLLVFLALLFGILKKEHDILGTESVPIFRYKICTQIGPLETADLSCWRPSP